MSADGIRGIGQNDPITGEVLGKALALGLLQSHTAIVTEHDNVLRVLVGRPGLYAEYSATPHGVRVDAREAITGVVLPEGIHRLQQLFQMKGRRRTWTSQSLCFFRTIELNGLAVYTWHSLFVGLAPDAVVRIDPPNELRARRDAFEVICIVSARHDCCSTER